MFEKDPFLNDREEKDTVPNDLSPNEPLGVNSLDGISGEPMRLPWEELPDETAEELKAEAETSMCEHEDAREVITKQSGAGAQFAGTGINATDTVSKVVCAICGGEWDTWDGSRQSSGRDQFGL